jgi:acyl transferase domain-containing protein/acyl carrier protein/nucleoside-diphosphate-sugar epimerase
MATAPQTTDPGGLLRRTLRAIDELEERLRRAEVAAREPIAVVGMGCRFPAADGPEALWRMLRDGVDAVGDVPADRRHLAGGGLGEELPGLRRGGFLAGDLGFDAAFFGISPREAEKLDPQQRLLLEVGWEACEHAGLAPDGLFGSSTGVFVGIATFDYALRLLTEPAAVDGFCATGSLLSPAAGRLAYALGLKGPAIAVDTACSSSLLAVHLACQSLRAGECDLALAGGVNRVLEPSLGVAFARAGMLAASGCCRAFAAEADGFVRAEGCGLVVLQRLSDALAAGLQPIVVVRGSAVNQDGRTSGLMAPNGPSQQAVVRRALAVAGLAPADIDYVEAHGTGTALGDPLEVGALAGVFGPGRPADRPLWIGSLKTNVGHMEGAAGIGGLIKTALALQRGELPPSLHCARPSPHIPWHEVPCRVVTERRPWPPAASGARRAGVSAFGFAGTNVHMVLEAAAPAEAPAARAPAPMGPHLIALSARTPEALRQAARRWAGDLAARPELDLAEVSVTSLAGRARLRQRLAVVAPSLGTAAASLGSWAEGSPCGPAVVTGSAEATAPALAFLYTGQGAQRAGMGGTLDAAEPVFRRALRRCAEIVDAQLPVPLLDLLFAPEAASRLDETWATQPCLFALEWALGELWRSWGVEPQAVLGHSIGGLAAACMAGVLDLEDGLRLAVLRGRLLQGAAGEGGMLAVAAGEAAVAQVLGQGVELAAVNAPERVVLAGPAAALASAARQLAARGVETRPLRVSHPFHSAAVEPALEAFEQAVRRVRLRPPVRLLISDLTGAEVSEEVTDAAYWRRQARHTVRFADGLATLGRRGFRAFVEIGPQPTLVRFGPRCLGEGSAWLPSLRAGVDDREALLQSLASLFALGVPVAGEAVAGVRRRVALPSYPWQHVPFAVAPLASRWLTGEHPLLGRRLHLAGRREGRWQARVAAGQPAFLADHRVRGQVLLPASCALELALAAAEAELGGGPLAVSDFRLLQPLELDRPVLLQAVLEPEAESWRFAVHAAAETTPDRWRLLATARVERAAMPDAPAAENEAELEAEAYDVAAYYKDAAARGLEFGPAFRPLRRLSRTRSTVFAELLPPPAAGRFCLDPRLWDGCLQAMELAYADASLHLPVAVERLVVQHGPTAAGPLRCRVDRRDAPRGVRCADVTLLDAAGAAVALLRGLETRRAPASPGADADRGRFFNLAWRPRPALAPLALRAAEIAAAARRPQVEGEAWRPRISAAALEAEALTLARAALIELGWSAADAPRPAADLARHLGVPGPRRLLLEAVLDHLLEAGEAELHDGCLTLRSGRLALPREAPASSPEADLLARCGARLAAVLRGVCDPLELLFPGGDPAAIAPLYRDAETARLPNALVAAALARAAEGAGPPLRVLEVGAGTGGATAALRPLIEQRRLRYTFSDVSPFFVALAERNLGGLAELRQLDIERDAEAQGFLPHSFDLVLAANVLHATADVAAALGHVGRLLAPGGLLLLLEATTRRCWVDLTFGMTDGWWRFRDRERRPAHPLLDAAGWRRALAEAGFAAVEAVEPAVAACDLPLPQTLFVAQAPAPAGNWLVLGDRGGIGAALAAALECAGLTCRLVGPGTAAGEAARAVASAVPQPDGIVHLASLDGKPALALGAAALAARLDDTLGSALELVQAAACLGRLPRLVFVTRGAAGLASPGSAAGFDGLPGAALRGFVRVVAEEHPELRPRLVDLDPTAPDDERLARDLAGEVLADDGEESVALAGGGRWRPRWVRAPLSATGEPVRLKAASSYLITGGFGGLGLVAARWLVERGGRDLILMGRRGAETAPPGALAELVAAGARITAVAGDVRCREDMARAVGLAPPHAPLRGVIHAVGVLDDAWLSRLDRRRLSEVVLPKAIGAWNLAAVCRGFDLDFFFLFSSVIGVLGNPGQANHAAANSFLDGLAAALRGAGWPATAVAWGPVAEVGAAARLGVTGALERFGIGGLAAHEVAAALDAVAGSGAAQVGVMRFSREPGERVPLLEELATKAALPGPADFRLELAEVPAAERPLLLRQCVRQEVAAVLNLPAAELTGGVGFFDLGMDSLMALELRSRLQASLGQSLPATFAFTYPTVELLVEHLLAAAVGGGRQEPAAAAAASSELGVPAAALARQLLEAQVQGRPEVELERSIDAELDVLLGEP